MKKVDYFAKNFFSHRLVCAIRATGDPEKKYEDYKDNFTTDHIFDLVELINQIIKGFLNFIFISRYFIFHYNHLIFYKNYKI